jgi:hypothetical protein
MKGSDPITAFGVTKPAAEWVAEAKARGERLKLKHVANRLGFGWSPERAVSAPVSEKKAAWARRAALRRSSPSPEIPTFEDFERIAGRSVASRGPICRTCGGIGGFCAPCVGRIKDSVAEAAAKR